MGFNAWMNYWYRKGAYNSEMDIYETEKKPRPKKRHLIVSFFGSLFGKIKNKQH